MYLDRVRLLLEQVIGGDRVLFAPGKLATLKIISLLSEIIHMMPSFACHFFSCFLVMFPEEYLEEVLIHKTNKGLSVPMDIQDYIQ